jgi:NAD(P)-dependent dehydrogenase (short-subunit alcohol dehydrogenase family)
VAALRAASEMGGYAATKAGLVMLTQSLAVDHAAAGLRANVVCPSFGNQLAAVGRCLLRQRRRDTGGRRRDGGRRWDGAV